MQETPLNILIVDDHAIVRRGLREIILEKMLDVVIECDEAESASQARQKLAECSYSLMLLDISLPDMSGLDLLKEIKQKYPQLPVLIVSIYSEQQFAETAFKNGASGYLTKDAAPDDLCTAIVRIMNGGRFVSAEYSEQLLSGLLQPTENIPLHASLSERERQVADMLVVGVPVKVISARLNLSEKTVTTYRSRTLEKLKLNSNAELVSYFIRHGLMAN